MQDVCQPCLPDDRSGQNSGARELFFPFPMLGPKLCGGDGNKTKQPKPYGKNSGRFCHTKRFFLEDSTGDITYYGHECT